MARLEPETRSFSVYLQDSPARYARTVEEPSFEAAAVTYLEEAHLEADDEDEARLVVRDLETGREHCFVVDLRSGDAEPCG